MDGQTNCDSYYARIAFAVARKTDGHRYHDSPLRKTSNWMENCTKFGQLILSKIIKIVATSC